MSLCLFRKPGNGRHWQGFNIFDVLPALLRNAGWFRSVIYGWIAWELIIIALPMDMVQVYVAGNHRKRIPTYNVIHRTPALNGNTDLSHKFLLLLPRILIPDLYTSLFGVATQMLSSVIYYYIYIQNSSDGDTIRFDGLTP